MTGPQETLKSNDSLEDEEIEDDEDEYEDEEEDCDNEEDHCDNCGCTDCRFACVGGKCEDKYAEFVAHLEKCGFEYLGSGGFRRTYRRKGVVIKVPHVHDGIMDNRVEAAAWRKYKSKPTDLGVYLAPCRLLPNGCLMMVALNMWDWAKEKPEWARKIDSSQIGMRNGKALAYDYGLDVSERAYWEDEWNEYSTFFQDDWLERKPHLRKKQVA